MNEDRRRMARGDFPVVQILCGIGAGKGRLCDRHVGSLGISGSDVVGREGTLTHAPSGARSSIVICPKHGMLVVSDSAVLAAFNAAQRSGKARAPIARATSRLVYQQKVLPTA